MGVLDLYLQHTSNVNGFWECVIMCSYQNSSRYDCSTHSPDWSFDSRWTSKLSLLHWIVNSAQNYNFESRWNFNSVQNCRFELNCQSSAANSSWNSILNQMISRESVSPWNITLVCDADGLVFKQHDHISSLIILRNTNPDNFVLQVSPCDMSPLPACLTQVWDHMFCRFSFPWPRFSRHQNTLIPFIVKQASKISEQSNTRWSYNDVFRIPSTCKIMGSTLFAR